jgi:hypothetical protein
MTGQQLWEAARVGDAAKVSTLLSTQGAQSFMNYQGADGYTKKSATLRRLRQLLSRLRVLMINSMYIPSLSCS